MVLEHTLRITKTSVQLYLSRAGYSRFFVIIEIEVNNMTLHIEWLGHSSFKLINNEYIIVIDPFGDNVIPGLSGVHETAHLILCSHEHKDHNAKENIQLLPFQENPFKIIEIESYHDNNKGLDRGKNKMVVLYNDSIKIVHLGDIGCMPESNEMELMKSPDVLFVPVGGHYTLNQSDIVTLIGILEPKVIVPMHYRSEEFGPKVIGTLSEFVEIMNFDVVDYQSSHFNYTKNMVKHIAVLYPKNKQ